MLLRHTSTMCTSFLCKSPVREHCYCSEVFVKLKHCSSLPVTRTSHVFRQSKKILTYAKTVSSTFEPFTSSSLFGIFLLSLKLALGAEYNTIRPSDWRFVKTWTGSYCPSLVHQQQIREQKRRGVNRCNPRCSEVAPILLLVAASTACPVDLE